MAIVHANATVLDVEIRLSVPEMSAPSALRRTGFDWMLAAVAAAA